MNKPMKAVLLLAFIMPLVGIVFSQSATPSTFSYVQTIGRTSPQGVRYDPNFDQFAMVDTGGQLVLADALTRETQHVLYEGGIYYGYEFSHDGRWIAVAQEGVVDIWNTQTGDLDLELQPTVALEFASRLEWSDDDELLLFKAVVPAPDEIRRSEDDTTLTPWLWDLEAERLNRTSILPERRLAQPFFDLRTDLLLTPNNKLISALPRSIGVMDFSDGSYDMVTNLETARFEFDPIDVWYGLRDEHVYFRSTDGTRYHQINTQTGLAHELPIGFELSARSIDAQSQLALSDTAQMIGEGNTLQTNSLARLLLGNRYHPDESRATVMLLDILDPVTVSDDQFGFLMYIFNEERGTGTIDLVRPESIRNIALHPNRTHLAVRRTTVDSPIEIYEIASGNLVNSFVTRYPDIERNDTFAFNEDGSALLVGWGRYDTFTGETLTEAPQYHPGFDDFVFSNDDQSLITIDGNELWEWDIMTGEPIRREIIRLNGEFLDTSDDSTRYLTRIPFEGENLEEETEGEETTDEEAEEELFGADTEDPDVVALLQEVEIPSLEIPLGLGVENYDVSTGERRQLYWEELSNRGIRRIVASPNWENYLVVYESNQYSPYYPGNEVALYNMDEGLKWFYAGDDLPAPIYRRYGWSDNETAFVLSGYPRPNAQPERIYGLEYHPSGLPACLVEGLPNHWEDYRGLWEMLNTRLDADELGRLTQTICAANISSVDELEAILSPTPTPTRPPIQPTSARIAGLPSCLSSYFGRAAADYAPQWRAMTEGLTDEAIAEVEDILCEGLSEGVNVPVPNVGNVRNNQLQVVSIDMATGEREVSAFAPLPVQPPRPLQPVLEAYQDQYGVLPSDAILSNNAELLAVRTTRDHVLIRRLNQPYQTFIDALEATRQANQEAQPVSVSILATPTAPGISLGGPRPTLTPTITPTAPAQPEATIAFEERDTVIELCDDLTLYSIFDPPPDYEATGRLLAIELNDSVIQVFDPATGLAQLEEGLVDWQTGLPSPTYEYLLLYTDQIVVSEIDGQNPVVLYETYEQNQFPFDLYWETGDTLHLRYNAYVPEEGEETVEQFYNAETGELSPQMTATPQKQINDITARVESTQPIQRELTVLSLEFNAGYRAGYRYFIYDMVTDELDYFARVSGGGGLSTVWNPSGDYLYYSFPQDSTWYIYDVATAEHRLLGELPFGDWSPTGRYRFFWYLPPTDELFERVDNDQPIPKISIWDSETGETRRYCVPRTGQNRLEAPVIWSPDERYVAFRVLLEGDILDDIPRERAVILDTETGRLIELGRDLARLIIWTE